MAAPPEGMASRVFRDPSRIGDVLSILRPTAKELRSLGVIDRIVPAAPDVADCQGMAKNIREFLVKSVKDLSRSRILKLIMKRELRAKNYGLTKGSGAFYDIKRYIEKPIKMAFHSPPPDIKGIDHLGLAEVSDDYGRIPDRESGKEYIECGADQGKDKSEKGCGKRIPIREFLENYRVCPECGYAYTLGAAGWVDCLLDPGSFHELYPNVTVDQLLKEEQITDHYRDFLTRQEGCSPFKESLVVGRARICHFQVVTAICEFYFCGGTLGVVFGEKFRRAVDYAIQERLPLISLCCSAGLRVYEGILALMQMVKTVESVNRLKRHGLPYISICADPSAGETLASHAGLGDITIAEPRALMMFGRSKGMESNGLDERPGLVRSEDLHAVSGKVYSHLDYYHDLRGVQEISQRKDMKRTIAKYLELYTRITYRSKKKLTKRGMKSWMF